MTIRFTIAGLVIVGLFALGTPLIAHHSWPIDQSRLVTVKGTVTDIMWANPHPLYTLEVRNGGQPEKWVVGGPALNRMEANGWNKSTLKIGDVITGIGYQFADGQKIVRLEKAVMPDGKEMFLYGRR